MHAVITYALKSMQSLSSRVSKNCIIKFLKNTPKFFLFINQIHFYFQDSKIDEDTEECTRSTFMLRKYVGRL